MLDGAFIPELFGASPCVVRKIWNEVEARVILVHLKTEAGNSLCGLEFVGLCLVDAFISTFNGEDLLGDCVVVTVGSEDSTREIKTEAERVKVGVCTEGEETFLEDIHLFVIKAGTAFECTVLNREDIRCIG